MKISYLSPGSAKYTGLVQDMMQFTMDHQLMDAATWQAFVQVYRADSDDDDMGWRCEYWGKMMRGAVLTYQYNGDEALYKVLDTTMRDLLTTARKDGRFSTYSDEKQLTGGWDVWGRKYILSGSLYFYRICKDETLKNEILSAMMHHADALIRMIGKEEDGKRSIFRTSFHWKGVNSCSVLESMLDLYLTTKEQRYLDFAAYLIETGGCEDANLIDLALEGKLMPYEYPEQKAYETMSFFEGVLLYGEITGEDRYVQAALRFMEAVYESDITVIGCSGCTHELFDHSGIRQIIPSDGIMQETCVTVTWIRMLDILYRKTGDLKYIDRMERSIFNALYGAVNTHMQDQLSMEDRVWMHALPFDSYSPLFNGPRGIGIGGFKKFTFGGYYGCCACIASAGIALAGLCGAMKETNDDREQNLRIHFYLPGTIRMDDLVLECHLGPAQAADAQVVWKVLQAPAEPVSISIRIAEYMENASITFPDDENSSSIIPLENTSGSILKTMTRIWHVGDEICLKADLSLKTQILGEGDERKICFLYGPLVLCRDAAKDFALGSDEPSDDPDTLNDLSDRIEPVEPLAPIMLPAEASELIRLQLPLTNGQSLLLTDYQSCGKNWLGLYNHITVWHQL